MSTVNSPKFTSTKVIVILLWFLINWSFRCWFDYFIPISVDKQTDLKRKVIIKSLDNKKIMKGIIVLIPIYNIHFLQFKDNHKPVLDNYIWNFFDNLSIQCTYCKSSKRSFRSYLLSFRLFSFRWFSFRWFSFRSRLDDDHAHLSSQLIAVAHANNKMSEKH